MIWLIKKIDVFISYLTRIPFKYFVSSNKFRVSKCSTLNISSTAQILNSKIFLLNGARLEIGENCRLSNAEIYVDNGDVVLSNNVIVSSTQGVIITIQGGKLRVNNHSKLSLKRIWIRFGGSVKIGSYTNINGDSEIRSDESVTIGSYNQISYGVKIWDTNTHNILSKEERRKVTENYFPYFGYESSKPKTSPIIIGDDCWIGEKASILKGTKLGDEVIVGYNCLLSGQEGPDKSLAVSKSVLEVRLRN